VPVDDASVRETNAVDADLGDVSCGPGAMGGVGGDALEFREDAARIAEQTPEINCWG